MQSLVLEKTIVFPKTVDELIQVTIDDAIDYVNKSEGVLIKGKIYLNGEVSLEGDISEFLDTLDVDIYASLDQLIDKKQVQLRVDDFDFHLKDNKLTFYLKVLIEGVNDVKSTFPGKESDSLEEKKDGTVETIEIPKQEDVFKSPIEEENEERPVDDFINLDEKTDEIIDDPILKEENNIDIIYSDFIFKDEQPKKSDKRVFKQAEPTCEFIYKDFDKNEYKQKKPEVDKINIEQEISVDVPSNQKDVNVKIDCDLDIDVTHKKVQDPKLKQGIEKMIKDQKIDETGQKEVLELLKDAIVIDDSDEFEVIEVNDVSKVIKQEKDHKPIKIIEEKPKKVESNDDTFKYFNLFRNQKQKSTVFWSYRVVLNDDTYDSLASELRISKAKLQELNNFKELKVGMLIKIPK